MSLPLSLVRIAVWDTGLPAVNLSGPYRRTTVVHPLRLLSMLMQIDLKYILLLYLPLLFSLHSSHRSISTSDTPAVEFSTPEYSEVPVQTFYLAAVR